MGIGTESRNARIHEATKRNDEERQVSIIMLVMAGIHLALSEDARDARVHGAAVDLRVGFEHGVWTVWISADGRVARADWPPKSRTDELKLSLPSRGNAQNKFIAIDWTSPQATAALAVEEIRSAFDAATKPPTL
jgi:hypothetical protein